MIRAALIGVACGLRSSAGPAALAWTTPLGGRHPRPLSGMTGRWGRLTTGSAALGELVADKNPRTPSRLIPPALAARAVSGATAALALAQRERGSRLTWALAGAAGAVGGSYAGAKWRELAAERFGNDLPGAIAEDAATLALVAGASRPV